MPAARKPKATEAAPAEATAAETSTEATNAEAADAGTATGAEGEDVPMNRAERRAKGKGTGQQKASGKIMVGKTNVTHGHRSYANRRSG